MVEWLLGIAVVVLGVRIVCAAGWLLPLPSPTLLQLAMKNALSQHRMRLRDGFRVVVCCPEKTGTRMTLKLSQMLLLKLVSG